MPSEWQDTTDPSDDEVHPDQQTSNRKRSSRACDQCRKTKSKCERVPPDAEQCKSCAAAGLDCTYLGPSYKRGPPKGYIHAIEQRWQQVESVLGAIIACPDSRAQGVIADLRRDALAAEILARVEGGPYGPLGRLQEPAGATKEDFFASILKSTGQTSGGDHSRSRRQSRLSREFVSAGQDNVSLAAPTTEWQDHLVTLVSSSHFAPPSASYIDRSFPSSTTSTTFDMSGAPFAQRRRLNEQAQPDWNSLYTLDSALDNAGEDNAADAVDGVGQLSLDEHEEVRYHGKASGLHLLPRNDREDDRNEGGIWKLPMARVWPLGKNREEYFKEENDIEVVLPPQEEQDQLVELYFNYVHPHFPVIHKGHFMSEYKKRNYSVPGSDKSSTATALPGHDPQQAVSKLLLLCMFAHSARYLDEPVPPTERGKMWEAGCDHLNHARNILSHLFHRSRTTTCQALLLLGHREFGIGSMEQGWIFIGKAIRMAFDLGLNRNSDNWKSNGDDLFTPQGKQIRKQIWWSCVVMDKFSSVYMGRPTMISENDFDTPLPAVDQAEDLEPWEPLQLKAIRYYPPTPGRIYSCFTEACKLAVILEDIVTHIYAVRPEPKASLRAHRESLESRLDQWLIDLDDNLRFDSNSQRTTPPPTVLLLNMQYWSAVALLQRAFIPNWAGRSTTPERETDTAGARAFDLSQSAAIHVSTIGTVYRNTFGLKCCPPSMSSYLFHAGIMHIVGMTVRPSNLQGSLGLQECLDALKEMEVVWPSAERAWDLLHGSKSRFEVPWSPPSHGPEREKRQADDAFRDKSGLYDNDSRVSSASGSGSGASSAGMYPGVNGIQDMSSVIMANMLGLDIPGHQPSNQYYNPAYDFWAQSVAQNAAQIQQQRNQQLVQGQGQTSMGPSHGVPESFGAPQQQTGAHDWMQGFTQSNAEYGPYDFQKYGL